MKSPVNETEQASASLPNTTNRVVAVFDSLDAATRAADALSALGITEPVTLQCGARAAQDIAFEGGGKDLVSKVQRTAHWMVDVNEMREFDAELRAGHCLLSLQVGLLPDLAPFVRVLTDHGGRYIHHFGPMVVSMLAP